MQPGRWLRKDVSDEHRLERCSALIEDHSRAVIALQQARADDALLSSGAIPADEFDAVTTWVHSTRGARVADDDGLHVEVGAECLEPDSMARLDDAPGNEKRAGVV